MFLIMVCLDVLFVQRHFKQCFWYHLFALIMSWTPTSVYVLICFRFMQPLLLSFFFVNVCFLFLLACNKIAWYRTNRIETFKDMLSRILFHQVCFSYPCAKTRERFFVVDLALLYYRRTATHIINNVKIMETFCHWWYLG